MLIPRLPTPAEPPVGQNSKAYWAFGRGICGCSFLGILGVTLCYWGLGIRASKKWCTREPRDLGSVGSLLIKDSPTSGFWACSLECRNSGLPLAWGNPRQVGFEGHIYLQCPVEDVTWLKLVIF